MKPKRTEVTINSRVKLKMRNINISSSSTDSPNAFLRPEYNLHFTKNTNDGGLTVYHTYIDISSLKFQGDLFVEAKK